MKKIKYIALAIGTLFFLNNKVSAGGSLSASTSQVSNGSSFTVTASISGAAAWNVHVSASGPVSGCSISVADSSADAMNTSKSFSATCKATGTGTITIRLSGDITSQDGANSAISGTRTVTVVGGGSSGGSGKQQNNSNNNNNKNDNKSGNNYLKKYEIEGYKISPEFNKDTTDYTLTVPNGTNEVKIIQEKEDSKATVSGDDGTVQLKEGENKFSTTVTAENGSKRTYNITIKVDTKPIVVKLGGKEYTLVKNKDELPNLDIEHEDTTLVFEEQEIPAYLINKIGYMLVGLRDSEGNVKLYRYVSYKNNEKPEEYHLFNYLKVRDMFFIYLDFPKNKIPDNYKQYKEKIGDVEYTVYKLNKDSKYSLLYCINFETGKKNIYRYNSEENTIQLYTNEEALLTQNKTSKYKKFILALGAVIVFLLLLTTIGFTRKPKNNNKSKKENKKTKEENENKLEISDEDKLSKKEIKKIEKKTKKQEKKQKKKQKKGEPDM